MKFCLIFVTLFAGLQAMPQNRADAFPQRIQMKDLAEICEHKYGLDDLVEGWGEIQSHCLGWDRADLIEDQFINMQDEDMFLCSCSMYAVEADLDYFALWSVNEAKKEFMENYVSYDDYYEALYGTDREETWPQRIQMKDLEQTCEDRYGLEALVKDWGNHQSDCLGWNRSDLLEDQFINMQDEHMFHCSCSIYAVEKEWDYQALWIVNEHNKEFMENYVEYTDYTEAMYGK